ncbi:hypothetical protein [Halanaerobium congolense]|nr:hypothetical protein [Halanaerobium congolense]
MPALKDKKLTLVIIRGMGKKPTLLISNLKPDAKKFTLAIINIILEDGE